VVWCVRGVCVTWVVLGWVWLVRFVQRSRGEIAQDTLGGFGGARAALERLCVVQKGDIQRTLSRISSAELSFFYYLAQVLNRS
jgi:hypothetical protein